MSSRIAANIVSILSIVTAMSCGRDHGEGGAMMERDSATSGMMREGMMGDMPDWMMSRGQMMDPQMMRDMPVIHKLLTAHEQIQREVEDVPGGIRSVTTSRDPEIAQLIRTHVWQMKQRIEDGRPIRLMDPVFRELFEHHHKIDIEIEEVSGGVRVLETSDDPQVTLLIRQHARDAVSEFVEGGMRRAMQPTPLPDGYTRPN